MARLPQIKKKFKPSSKRWIQRQLTDRYVLQAKEDGYRCRSAYKLLEIDEKFKILGPRQTVVDLGCAPGSWTQVAVRKTRADEAKYNSLGSLVVGIDLREVNKIKGATIISGMDFTTPEAVEEVMNALRNRRVNVVLSDMAPNTTGNLFCDHCRVTELCYSALRFVERVCTRGASLVMKVFDGEDCRKLITDTRKLFEQVKVVHPKATRKPSSEMFYVGLRYKGTTLPAEDEETDTNSFLYLD